MHEAVAMGCSLSTRSRRKDEYLDLFLKHLMLEERSLMQGEEQFLSALPAVLGFLRAVLFGHPAAYH